MKYIKSVICTSLKHSSCETLSLSSTSPAHKYYLAMDPMGEVLYVSDTSSRRVYRVRNLGQPKDPSRNLEVVAGTGEQCLPFDQSHCGEGRKATEAALNNPRGRGGAHTASTGFLGAAQALPRAWFMFCQLSRPRVLVSAHRSEFSNTEDDAATAPLYIITFAPSSSLQRRCEQLLSFSPDFTALRKEKKEARTHCTYFITAHSLTQSTARFGSTVEIVMRQTVLILNTSLLITPEAPCALNQNPAEEYYVMKSALIHTEGHRGNVMITHFKFLSHPSILADQPSFIILLVCLRSDAASCWNILLFSTYFPVFWTTYRRELWMNRCSILSDKG